MNAQKFTKDGVEYELWTPEMVARDEGDIILINKKTGKKKNASAWLYETEKKPLPPGWEIDRSQPPVTREKHGKFIGEVADLFEKHGATVPLPGQKTAVPRFEADYFWSSVGFNDYYCVTARREGKLIGTISFRIDHPKGGDRAGYLDLGVVGKAERRSLKNENGGGTAVSDTLMRLAIATLVKDFNCRLVETIPISVQGEKFDESNGLRHVEELKYRHTDSKVHQLDRRVVDYIKSFTRDNQAPKFDWAKMPELITKMKPIMEEIKGEIEAERSGGQVRL